MKLLSDNPILNSKEDKFGFSQYVDILEESISDTDSLPFTIGIFGEWGTGKTSLMLLLKKLCENNDFKTVWFDPWKYDNKEALWAAIIQSILIEINTNGKSPKLKKNSKDLLKKLAWFSIKEGIYTITGGMIKPDDIDKMKENINKISDTLIDFNIDEYNILNKFENIFSEIVNEYVGKNGRLIVFIDDLDRCIPKNAITVLESLKLYLDNSRCIFILGMDRSIIEFGINHKYGGVINLSGREYLDKIIQLPFFIPPIEFTKLRNFLSKKTKAANYSEPIWYLLEYGLGGNPRKAKRFVNCFYMIQKVLNNRIVKEFDDEPKENFENIPYDDKLYYLAKILIIQMNFPDFYNFLIYDSLGWTNFEKLINNPPKEGYDNYFKENPDLEKFWYNRDFHRFMKDTLCGINNLPKVPNSSALKRIIQLTGIAESKKYVPPWQSEGAYVSSQKAETITVG